MSRCVDYCTTISGTTNEEIWLEINAIMGGCTDLYSTSCVDSMNMEIAEYTMWISTNKIVPFDRWLIWKRRVGTANYGNLPENKKHLSKVGHSYAPCPYSSQSSELRTRHLLGLSETDTLPAKTDHSADGVVYYMKTASKGSIWGFSCTFPGCPYYILTGQKYFFT